MFGAIETALVARLKAACPAARAVFSAEDLAAVTEQESQTTPALHVMPMRYAIADEAIGRALLRQTWLVVCVTRNAAVARRGQAAATGRERVSALADEVVAALFGWRPFAGASPMALAQGPEPVFQGGFGYLPLAFSTDIIITGAEA